MVGNEQPLRHSDDESSAFQELVETHKKRVYYLALDLTGNHHDAEDLSQEVFIKAFRSIGDFRGDAKPGSWLYRITVNTFIDERRRKKLMMTKLMEYFRDDIGGLWAGRHAPNPEQKAENHLMQEYLDGALNLLSPQERAVFVLRHYEDLRLKEISQILHLAEGTVKSVLFRGIRKLQKALSNQLPQKEARSADV